MCTHALPSTMHSVQNSLAMKIHHLYTGPSVMHCSVMEMYSGSEDLWLFKYFTDIYTMVVATGGYCPIKRMKGSWLPEDECLVAGCLKKKSPWAVKCWLLGMAWLLNSSIHSHWECLCMIKPVKIPAGMRKGPWGFILSEELLVVNGSWGRRVNLFGGYSWCCSCLSGCHNTQVHMGSTNWTHKVSNDNFLEKKI